MVFKNPITKIPIILVLTILGVFACANIVLAQSYQSDIPEFTRSLSVGMRGDDIRKLQEFLARDSLVYPEKSITGFFGSKTREAVKKWQQKNGLPPVGIVGPKTIAKFKEIKDKAKVSLQESTPSAPSSESESPPGSTPSTTEADTTPPQITLDVNTPAPTKVYVEFNPSEEVTVVYEYGLTTKYGFIKEVWNQYFSSPAGIAIEGLTPLTTYHLRARATDRAGNVGYSPNYTVTTPGLTQAPVISSGPRVTASTALPATAVTISWNTNIPCAGTLYYGGSTAYANTQRTEHSTDHAVTITGLAPNAGYIFKIDCATAAADKMLESGNYLFTATSSATSLAPAPLAAVFQILGGLINLLFPR